MSPITEKQTGLRSRLASAPISVFVLHAGGEAFCPYFCMYALRRPLAAAKFEGLEFLGTAVDLTTAPAIGQLAGYALSKFIGIRSCSEITPSQRHTAALVLPVVAAETQVRRLRRPDQERIGGHGHPAQEGLNIRQICFTLPELRRPGNTRSERNNE